MYRYPTAIGSMCDTARARSDNREAVHVDVGRVIRVQRGGSGVIPLISSRELPISRE